MNLSKVTHMTLRKASLAAITAAAVLFGLVPATQAELRVGPNYNLASDPSNFRGRDQIGLAVSRTDPQRVAAVNANYLDLVCEASASTDGGDTWTRAVPLLPPDPAAGQAAFSKRCNFHQSVQFGSGLNVYAIVVASRVLPAFPDAEVLVYKSADGGATWGRGVVAMPGGPGRVDSNAPNVGPSYFRPALAVDPGTGGAPDKVYAIARDLVGAGNGGVAPDCVSACNVVRVAVSSDNGATFGPAVNASPPGTNAHDPPVGVVNDDGSVTVVWRQSGSGTPTAANPSNVGKLQASRSATPGTAGSWSAPVDIAGVKNTGGSTHLIPRDGVTGASTTATYPRLATDPTRPESIYLVYGQTPPGPTPPAGGFQGADHFIGYDSRSASSGPRTAADVVSAAADQRHDVVPGQHHPPDPPAEHLRLAGRPRQRRLARPSTLVPERPAERRQRHQRCVDGTPVHVLAQLLLRHPPRRHVLLVHSLNGGDTFSSDIRISDRSHNSEVGYDTRPASGYWSWGPQVVTVGGGKDPDRLDGFARGQLGYRHRRLLPRQGGPRRHGRRSEDARSTSRTRSRVRWRSQSVAYRGGNEGALTGGPFDPANQNPPITVPAGARLEERLGGRHRERE